jgi:prepilin-type N-terminal cleavage/methylation domain-containing protein
MDASRRGFTLIELILVIAMLLVVLSRQRPQGGFRGATK